ncbi:MAG: DUF1232 domain-containing protein, partial [Chitinivibrionales bacterium]|nr:DUF1232 domain-containing protein [Chitinivibrionales bacterium]
MSTTTRHDDFYLRLRARVKGWAAGHTVGETKWLEYVLAAPDLFYLLVRLTLDGDVPLQHKAMLAVAVAYFVSPIDLIPDFIPIAGMLDDISLAAYVLNKLLNDVDPEVVRRHWAGEGDILGLISRILRQ